MTAHDSLDQHRRELDATFAALQSVRDHGENLTRATSSAFSEIRGLRAGLASLSDRVGALTRAVGVDNGDHSRRAAWTAADNILLVYILNADEPVVLGPYVGVADGELEYVAAGGGIRRVSTLDAHTVRRGDLAALLARGAGS